MSGRITHHVPLLTAFCGCEPSRLLSGTGNIGRHAVDDKTEAAILCGVVCVCRSRVGQKDVGGGLRPRSCSLLDELHDPKPLPLLKGYARSWGWYVHVVVMAVVKDGVPQAVR